MSLTTKAIDRMIARVVEKLADRIVMHPTIHAGSFPVNPEDVSAALDRAARQITQERFSASLDAGAFDHRVNDTVDFEVEKRLKDLDLEDLAKDQLERAVEDRIDASGFDRQLSRAVEGIDLEAMAEEKIDELDAAAVLKDAAEEHVQREASDIISEGAEVLLRKALRARYDSGLSEQGLLERAAADATTCATAEIVGAISTTLEQDAEVQS